jgi:hypothetical protein
MMLAEKLTRQSARVKAANLRVGWCDPRKRGSSLYSIYRAAPTARKSRRRESKNLPLVSVEEIQRTKFFQRRQVSINI